MTNAGRRTVSRGRITPLKPFAIQSARRCWNGRGLFELEALPEDALDALRLQSARWRLPVEMGRRGVGDGVPSLEGFSLHANTQVHGNDRSGFETLYRYGAGGALSLGRLSKREDGRLSWHRVPWASC